MSKRVAVVADAVSPDYIFPIWLAYYGSLFQIENLFVITYAGLGHLFQGFGLGGVIQLPVGYDDITRRGVISAFVTSLLPCYDTVIRVDLDEFLVVDPRVSPSLASFITEMDAPYMTARGFDVVQLPGEAPITDWPHRPILSGRSVAYPNTALNKTCIVKVPVNWSPGFHAASVYPKFGPLFMLHTKFLDMDWQIGWFTKMSGHIKDNPNVKQRHKDYYSPDEKKIRDHHDIVSRRPHVSGLDNWYRIALVEEFTRSIHFVPKDSMYFAVTRQEPVLCELPSEWKTLL